MTTLFLAPIEDISDEESGDIPFDNKNGANDDVIEKDEAEAEDDEEDDDEVEDEDV